MQWLNEDQYTRLAAEAGMRVVDRTLEAAEIPIRALQDMARYWLFIDGALPVCPSTSAPMRWIRGGRGGRGTGRHERAALLAADGHQARPCADLCPIQHSWQGDRIALLCLHAWARQDTPPARSPVCSLLDTACYHRAVSSCPWSISARRCAGNGSLHPQGVLMGSRKGDSRVSALKIVALLIACGLPRSRLLCGVSWFVNFIVSAKSWPAPGIEIDNGLRRPSPSTSAAAPAPL